MNLMADSGAILSTLMPFPLHSEETPPSCTIPRSPDHRLTARDEEPCTWNQAHFILEGGITSHQLQKLWKRFVKCSRLEPPVVFSLPRLHNSCLTFSASNWRTESAHCVFRPPPLWQPTVCFFALSFCDCV